MENRLFLQKARGTFQKGLCHHPKMLQIVRLHCHSSLPVVCRSGICLENSPSQPCIEVCASKTRSASCVSYRTSQLRTEPTALVRQRRSDTVTVYCEQCGRSQPQQGTSWTLTRKWSRQGCSTISEQTVSRKLYLRPYLEGEVMTMESRGNPCQEWGRTKDLNRDVTLKNVIVL